MLESELFSNLDAGESAMLRAGFDILDRCAIELGKFRLLDGN